MEQENKPVEEGKTVEQHLIDIARSHNGFKYFGVSRIERLPDSAKDYSALTQQLFMIYMSHKYEKDFMEVFGDKSLCFIQAFWDIPTMSKDGMYNPFDVNGVPIKCHLAGKFIIPGDCIDNFKPMLICKERGDDGQLKFGKIIGDPFHTASTAEIATVLKENQPNAVKKQEEQTK